MTQELICISAKYVEESILLIRGKKVILDRVLAGFYGVSTSALNQAVKRNPERFPSDFRFQLTIEETRTLKPARQKARGKHVKYRPYVYTEHGILMLSTVLRNDRAIQVNIQIVRAFIHLREWIASNEELTMRVDELERTCDSLIKIVSAAIRQLRKPRVRKRREIGFRAKFLKE
jgi:ORF6N domain